MTKLGSTGFGIGTLACLTLGLSLSGSAAYAMTYGTVDVTVNLPASGQKTNNLRTSALPGTTVYAGQFSGTFNTPSSGFTPPNLVGDNGTFDFVGWCLEPQEFWKKDWNYSFVDIGDAPVVGAGTTMSARNVEDDMQRLFGGINPNTASFLSDQKNRDAFQLAVWEIANEDVMLGGKVDFDVDAGSFKVTWLKDNTNYKNDVIALANQWLDGAANEGAGEWSQALLRAIVSPGSGSGGRQDFVVQLPGLIPPDAEIVSAVPLPAAAWLFGSAFVGILGVAGWRRV